MPETDLTRAALVRALWRIYNRPHRPTPWVYGGNLPWDDPAFSERMLREHLDDTQGAASRVSAERALQLDWLWQTLALRPGAHLLDVTCGPGLYAVSLAQRGVRVTGVDFGPAALRHARDLAAKHDVAALCTFLQQDVRALDVPDRAFDAAMVLYGQLAVMTRDDAQQLLTRIAGALKPGGTLVIELLDPARVDKTNSTWWFTDDTGLWGDGPYLHLGERFWDEAAQLSAERYHILHLDSGHLDEILLNDQVYASDEMRRMLRSAGFSNVDVLPQAAGMPLYDAAEWVYYVAALPDLS